MLKGTICPSLEQHPGPCSGPRLFFAASRCGKLQLGQRYRRRKERRPFHLGSAAHCCSSGVGTNSQVLRALPTLPLTAQVLLGAAQLLALPALPTPAVPVPGTLIPGAGGAALSLPQLGFPRTTPAQLPLGHPLPRQLKLLPLPTLAPPPKSLPHAPPRALEAERSRGQHPGASLSPGCPMPPHAPQALSPHTRLGRVSQLRPLFPGSALCLLHSWAGARGARPLPLPPPH